MSLRRALLIAGLVLLVAPLAALADTINPVTPGAAWQTWTAADLDKDGRPYWDNTSWDGINKNIGYCMTGTGNCVMSHAPGALPFWGMSYNKTTDSGGAADTDITFNRTSTASNASLIVELAGNANFNVFGWYDTAHPSTLHPIFNGPATAGATATFSPSASYGFYLTDNAVGVGETWYSNAGRNSSRERSDQHFAIFKGSGQAYWIGMEDLPLCRSDRDYNDMVVEIAPVPEPGTLVLLGTGLVGLAGLLRKKLLS